MRGFGDFAFDDFLESVDAFALGVEGVHEMHVRSSAELIVGYSLVVVGYSSVPRW